MNQINEILSIDPGRDDDVILTCASFEDRCLGLKIYGNSYRCSQAVLIRFRSKKNSIQDRRRAANFEELRDYLHVRTSELHMVETERHNPHSLGLALTEEIPCWNGHGLRVTVDISCFTRVQLLFLLRHLLSLPGILLRILYSVPTYYGSLENKELAFDYDKMLVLPFSFGSYEQESLSPERVLVISLGHEGGRALYAWRFLDPKSTVLIFPGSRHSPDLSAVVMRRNRELIQRLEMGDASFSSETVDSHDIESARLSFENILLKCAAEGGERALYFMPGGPKPVAVGLALAARDTKVPIYLAYPVPRTYSNAYSAGLARILEHRVGTPSELERGGDHWAAI